MLAMRLKTGTLKTMNVLRWFGRDSSKQRGEFAEEFYCGEESSILDGAFFESDAIVWCDALGFSDGDFESSLVAPLEPCAPWYCRASGTLQATVRLMASDVKKSALFVRKMIWNLILLPVRIIAWILGLPSRGVRWFQALPWSEMLMVRKGFVFGLVIGLSAAGTGLWALSAIPYLPGHPISPIDQFSPIVYPASRISVPTELAWFFIQFPYVSEKASIRSKNHHNFLISDSLRHRDYVVILGQRFRRIEVYDQANKASVQVFIDTPGYKKTVSFHNNRITKQLTVPDGNLWMWRSPLWNAMHLKIYGLADVWLDSPFKRYSCAGFVHRFLLDAGVRVPILDAWDMAKLPWARVSMEELEPGDIITIRAASREHRRFWHHQITHVGVYIGHGKMIHASTASEHATRSWIRVSDIGMFRGRIDKILRPPELE